MSDVSVGHSDEQVKCKGNFHSLGEWQFPLHLSYSIEWPALTSDMEGTKSFSHEQNGSALTSDLLVRMAVALTSVLLDRMANTHI